MTLALMFGWGGHAVWQWWLSLIYYYTIIFMCTWMGGVLVVYRCMYICIIIL